MTQRSQSIISSCSSLSHSHLLPQVPAEKKRNENVLPTFWRDKESYISSVPASWKLAQRKLFAGGFDSRQVQWQLRATRAKNWYITTWHDNRYTTSKPNRSYPLSTVPKKILDHHASPSTSPVSKRPQHLFYHCKPTILPPIYPFTRWRGRGQCAGNHSQDKSIHLNNN